MIWGRFETLSELFGGANSVCKCIYQFSIHSVEWTFGAARISKSHSGCGSAEVNLISLDVHCSK